MRLFVAIHVPPESKKILTQVVADLDRAARRFAADVKCVKPEQLHFTLKFLGECQEEKLSQIIESLKIGVEGTAPFAVRLGTLGTFPEKGSPRVLWAGLQEGAEPMRELAERVEAACELVGFPRENRPFSAHVTVARGRGSKNMAKLRAFWEAQTIPALEPWSVRSVTLVRSVLSSKGPTYSDVSEAIF